MGHKITSIIYVNTISQYTRLFNICFSQKCDLYCNLSCTNKSKSLVKAKQEYKTSNYRTKPRYSAAFMKVSHHVSLLPILIAIHPHVLDLV